MATVIKCIVADKKAVDVVRLLKDFALEPPVVEPLDELGPPKAAKGSLTKDIYAFVERARQDGVKVIKAEEFRKLAQANGTFPTSYSYAVKRLIRDRKLKHGKAPTTYEVLK